jgi:hypothetical protein
MNPKQNRFRALEQKRAKRRIVDRHARSPKHGPQFVSGVALEDVLIGHLDVVPTGRLVFLAGGDGQNGRAPGPMMGRPHGPRVVAMTLQELLVDFSRDRSRLPRVQPDGLRRISFQ